MLKIITILIGYFLLTIIATVVIILSSLSLGWLLNWLIPSIDLGITSILSLISFIYGAKVVFYFNGLQRSAENFDESDEYDDEEDEDVPSKVVYINPTIINRKPRKPRKR